MTEPSSPGPSTTEAILADAVSKLSGLNARLDSLDARTNARLDERDKVVAAVADTIARLAERMDSYEAREAEPLEDDAPPGADYPVGQLAEGPEALEDDEAVGLPPALEPTPIALEE